MKSPNSTLSGRLTRRGFIGGSLGAGILSGCIAPEADHDTHGRPIITVWHPWVGVRAPGIERTLKAFEKSHPQFNLHVVYAPNDLANNQKFFTSVAAGKPPDVIFVDGPQVAEWGERGALLPLDDFLQPAGISAEDYWPPCWKQNQYHGKTWALTFGADPNFAFAWNKKDFRSVGLDPDRGPQTLAEMDQYCDRLTRVVNGRIERMGIIPWEQYGHANSMYTWGWVHGGSFYDEAKQKVTANHPKVVEALEWMIGYTRKYDVARVTGLFQGFGTAQMDPFYVGQMAMKTLHITGVDDIRRYASGLEYGLGYIPAPPTGEQHCSWVGGWCMALPAGARHPKQGFELIRWLCADPEGTSATGLNMSVFPGHRRSPAFKRFEQMPGMDQFYRILTETRHQRPVMPVQAYYMGSLTRAVDSAIYGKKTARQALDDCTEETQAELDLVLKGG